MAAAAMAADYTDSLAIYINGATTPVTTPATISVNQASNGTYTFTLKNFTLTMGGQTMYIGNVQLDNVYSFNGTNGRTILAGGKDVVIQNGDDASKQWIGPMMGEVEVALRSYLVDNRTSTVDLKPITRPLCQWKATPPRATSPTAGTAS